MKSSHKPVTWDTAVGKGLSPSLGGTELTLDKCDLGCCFSRYEKTSNPFGVVGIAVGGRQATVLT